MILSLSLISDIATPKHIEAHKGFVDMQHYRYDMNTHKPNKLHNGEVAIPTRISGKQPDKTEVSPFLMATGSWTR